MTWYPQPRLQTMRIPGAISDVSGVVIQAPKLSVSIPTGDVVEGATARFQIDRTANTQGAVSVDWTATAVAGDLTGPTSGTATLPNGVTSVGVALQTVNRTGVQSPRQLTVTLSNVQGGQLDPAATSVVVPIADRTAVLPTWFNLPKRSGRAWASGTSGLTGTIAVDPNTALEQGVALLDAGCGGSRGPNDANVATWPGVIGGAVGSALVTDGTQFDWSTATSFGLYFQRTPVGSPSAAWLLWDMVLIPTSAATNTGDPAVWSQISAGSHDAEYQAMGARIVSAFAAKGHSLNRFIGCIHSGCNAGDYFQVFPATTAAYKAAIERAIAQIRVGAGTGNTLRFAHAVAFAPHIGVLQTWLPSTVDAIGVNYFPDNTVVDDASLADRLDATGLVRGYGLRTDLLDAADTLNLPVIVPRWAPRHEAGIGCPYSAAAVLRFYTDFLQLNSARVVCDCINNLTILNASGYLDTQTGGAADWTQASANYKSRWDGTKDVVVYTPPVLNISARVASVQEG